MLRKCASSGSWPPSGPAPSSGSSVGRWDERKGAPPRRTFTAPEVAAKLRATWLARWYPDESFPVSLHHSPPAAPPEVYTIKISTAIVAGGPGALNDITYRWPVDVLAVGRDGVLSATPGFRAALSQ